MVKHAGKNFRRRAAALVLSFAALCSFSLQDVLAMQGVVAVQDDAALRAGEEVAASKAGEEQKPVRQRVSVHDPSIVVGYKDADGIVYPNDQAGRQKIYYIFGSHMAWAYSTDLENWTTFQNNINDNYAQIFNEGAQWSKQGDAQYDISGNLWAPDVVWNKEMNKWCMYMSVNGNKWNSSIALLTSDSLEGDWSYEGTVIYSGFTASGNNPYTQTDYSEVTGQEELDSKFKSDNTSNTVWNMRYGAHAIDPCVFYDEEGQLWMSYGSWSGGIYIFRLDGATGFRDNSAEAKKNYTDAYMGTKLGGSTASGEASYIEHIGDYYYLFLSYGGLVANGGYNMRVFRSQTPDGTYVDVSGDAATKGGGTEGTIGTRLMSYYRWSWWDYAHVAQGHNSAFVDTDGNAYVIYHTRTNDGTEGHTVRVHQLFTTEQGYLVATPFEYSATDRVGGTYAASVIAGDYELLFQNNTDHERLEYNAPQHVQLKQDGTIAGDVAGTWTVKAGTAFVTLQIANTTYEGTFVEQTMEGTGAQTLCFTAVGDNDICLWGAKYPSDDDCVTIAADYLSLPKNTSADLVLPTEGILGTSVTWKSSSNTILADGTFFAPAVDRKVTLTATVKRGEAVFDRSFEVTAMAEASEDEGPVKIASYYTGETLDLSGKATASFDNPLNGRNISNGVTIKFKTKRTGNYAYLSNIFAFETVNDTSESAGRLYFTGGSYLGYNALGGFYDANVDNSAWASGNDYIGSDREVQVEINLTPTGFSVWMDGEKKYDQASLTSGQIKGSTNVADYGDVLTWLSSSATYLNFGFGNWWSDITYEGSVRDVEIWAEPVAGGSTNLGSNEYFKQDYEGTTGVNTIWAGTASVSKGTDRTNYVKIDAGGGSGNREANALISMENQPEGDYYFETDILLHSSTGNNGSTGVEQSFELRSLDGYLLKLYAAGIGNQAFMINDTEESVTLPAASWVKIHLAMNTADRTKAYLTVTDIDKKKVLIENKEIAVKGSGQISGMYVKVGRGGAAFGYTYIDNTVIAKEGLADYSAFNEALHQAKKYLKIADAYTESTIAALREAVDAAEKIDKQLDKSHQEEIDALEVRLVQAMRGLACSQHDYSDGTVILEPACTEAGSRRVVCYQCGREETVTIDALGHDFAAEFTVDIAPTVETAGSKSRHCTRCDAVTDVTVIDKLGTIEPGDGSETSGNSETTGTTGGNSETTGTTDGNTTPGDSTQSSAITLNRKSVTLYTGKASNTVKVKADVKGTAGAVRWESSNRKVATVTADGKIKAVKKGTAVVTAKIGVLSASVKVNVKDPTVTVKKAKKSVASIKLKAGKSVNLSVTVKPAKSGIVLAKLSAKDKKIVTARIKGGKLMIKAKKKGRVTLKITSGKAKKNIRVTVN